MLETVYVRTCSLLDWNCIKLAEDIKKWMPNASVYVRANPCQIVVCRGATATVINSTDIFSFVMRRKDITINDVINHSDKKDIVKVSINERDFLIETYVSSTVGYTDNIKFRLTCLNNPELSEDFDDYASVSNRISNYLWDSVCKKLRLV